MAFSNKKQQGSNGSEGVQSAPVKAKKKNEMLSSVLSESVVEKLLDEFRECEFFTGEYNGEPAYIGLMLDVNDIGGLSKKTNRDEDKGAIVEQIKSGRMQVLITPALLQDECMVFVPSLPTVDAMGEFGILTTAPYTLVWVTQQGDIVVTDKQVTFGEITEVYENDENAYVKFFGDNTTENDYVGQNQFTRPFDEDEPNYAPNEETTAGYDDIEEESEEDVPDESEYEYEDEGPAEYEEEAVYAEDEPADTNDDQVEYEYDDFPENEPTVPADDEGYVDDDDVAYSDEAVEETLARRLFSDDLNIEVTGEPFDMQFAATDTFVPFEENRGDGWLNGYLSQMAMDANSDLRQMHERNIQKMREAYFSYVTNYADIVQQKLDYKNPETKYGIAYNNIVDQKRQLLEDAPAQTEQRLAECEKKWNATLNEVGNNAATAAKAQYVERFGDMHNNEMRRIRTSTTEEIENGFNDLLRKLHSDRRAEANTLMNYAINASLQEISAMNDKCVRAEQARYAYHRDKMERFLETHRKDEVSRTKALEEELAHNNKVEQAAKDAEARVRAVKADCDDRIASMEANMADLSKRHAANVADINARNKERQDLLKEDLERTRQRNDELVQTISDLDAKKDKEYASRVNSLEQRVKTAESEQDRLIAMHKRSNLISGILFAVALVAVLAIGIIAGFLWHINAAGSDNKDTQAAITQSQMQKSYDGAAITEVPSTGIEVVTEAPTVPAKQTAPKASAKKTAPKAESPASATDEAEIETDIDTVEESE